MLPVQENCSMGVIKLRCSAEALSDPEDPGNTGFLYLNQLSCSSNSHLSPSKNFCF